MPAQSRSWPAWRSTAALLLVGVCLALGACGRSSFADADPQSAYDAAVQDARNVTAEKISKNLTAIVPENQALLWENATPDTRVLVATWLGNQAACAGYLDPVTPGCKAGSECANYGYNSWVTVVPELKNRLGRYPTLLRVEQTLGLPPPAPGQGLDTTCVLELYVSPAHLFRPAPDPEITDQEAELHFPTDGFRKFDDSRLIYSEMPCDPARCPACTPSGKCGMTTYRNWLDNRRAHVYSQTPVSSPYPWTGLGYTYDWGNPTPPHLGLSEFVIDSGASGVPVFIKTARWTRDYFAE